MKHRLKKIFSLLFTDEGREPKAYWIRIPQRFHNEKEKNEFLQKTITFVNNKTKINIKTIPYYEARS